MSRVIDDMILWDSLSKYEEFSDFYEYDIDSQEFRHALMMIRLENVFM